MIDLESYENLVMMIMVDNLNLKNLMLIYGLTKFFSLRKKL